MTWSTLLAAAVVPLLVLSPGESSYSDRRPAGRQSEYEAAAAAAVAVRPVGGRVVRTFDPPATRFGAGHRGVDLCAAAGQPVVAAMGGTVTFAGAVAGRSWVTVNHGGGLDTTYGPVEPLLVGAGEVVAPGEWLGFVAAGATHLDWGARLEGTYIDPLSLLGAWETYLTSPRDSDDLPALGGIATGVGSAEVRPGGMRRPAPGPATSGFGMRAHPVSGVSRMHAGLDIGAPAGQPVTAAAGGTVTFAGTLGGYGSTVTIDHGDGLATLYAHQSAIDVHQGQTVDAGDVLGRVGSSGLSTGPHLHFEVRVNGTAQDPLGWLQH